MIRIECKCKTCKTNAEKAGQTVLAALVPEALFANVKTNHGLVWQTNRPGSWGKTFRDSTGCKVA